MSWLVTSVTITNGTSLSGTASVPPGHSLAGINMPDAWTAASLTFQASHDNSDYENVYDTTGTEYQVTTSNDRFVPIDPVDFAGCPYIKVRSGTSGAAVNQGADRTLVLVLRRV